MNLSRLLFLVLVAAAIVLPVRLWVAEPIYIASASMEPTLPVGAYLVLDKLTLRRRQPRRGEFVVFVPPRPSEEHETVKRVIALPGETVELREKKVILNGEELYENYVVHKRAKERLQGDNLGPFTVPAGSLFVLGDNRDESMDSSVWKDPSSGQASPFLPIENVKGLARGFY